MDNYDNIRVTNLSSNVVVSKVHLSLSTLCIHAKPARETSGWMSRTLSWFDLYGLWKLRVGLGASYCFTISKCSSHSLPCGLPCGSLPSCGCVCFCQVFTFTYPACALKNWWDRECSADRRTAGLVESWAFTYDLPYSSKWSQY